MQRFPPLPGNGANGGRAPLILLFERNDAIAVPLIAQVRMAGYDVRAARNPVEVFDLLQHEAVDMVLIDLHNAAANRREFWVGLDSQRHGRTVHVLTFRYLATGETGDLESGQQRVARADVEIVSVHGFEPLIEAIRARLPGVTPMASWGGVPAQNLAPPSRGLPARQPTPLPGANPAWQPPGGEVEGEVSPFAQPYADNPFKRRSAGSPQSGGMPPPGLPPFQPSPPPAEQWQPPQQSSFTPAARSTPPGRDLYAGFGEAGAAAPQARGYPRDAVVEDAWKPPDASAHRRGVAYRGNNDDPLAPDDPRIEGGTSPVPAIDFANAGGQRNERALSTILMDSAVIQPNRLDALRSIQQTLVGIGMEFSIGDLAMLFKFLTPDQLLAAYLVSRGIVSPEQIASLGKVKQDLMAGGMDYDLETLLTMFNVLPPDEIRRLRAELG